MSLYPLKFRSLFKEKPWGGQKLKTFLGKEIPPHQKIGESWELADRGEDSTPVANGEYAGRTLHSLIKNLENRLLGDKIWKRDFLRFPLLYKILDVEALLSLQVHPPDDYARTHEKEGGKMEMWYVLQADPGAGVICGLREGIDRAGFEQLLREHQIEKAVRQFPVKKGDSVFVPPGRVHTISPSCLMVEIQQNSDITYRLHDWGRRGLNGRPRPLHLKQGLEVINFDDRESPLIQPLSETVGKNEIQILLICPAFTVELLQLQESYQDACQGKYFEVITCLEGAGAIGTSGGRWEIKPGEFILLPAYLGSYTILPADRISLLKSYVS